MNKLPAKNNLFMPWLSLPVILCTGHRDHAISDSAHATGPAAFFFKPLKLDELLFKVQELAAQDVK